MDGCNVVKIEYMRGEDGDINKVKKEMVEFNG